MLSPFRECFFDQIYFKYIPPPLLSLNAPTVIDVGANVGYFSLFALYRYPKARVFSFEPMPFNYRRLQEYQALYPDFDWHVEPKAVTDHAQTLTLHTSTVEGYTTMAGVFAQPSRSERIEVEAVSLPQVLTTHSIDQVDILKLDCEGSEYAIVYSLPPEVLARTRVLIIETHRGEKEHETTEALATYLQQHDFRMHVLSDGGLGYIWAWQD